jgi:hypothetical protein
MLILSLCIPLSTDGAIRAVKPKRRIERSNESKIKDLLFRKNRYDPTTRPVKQDNTTIQCHIAISLYHILDTVSLLLTVTMTTAYAL